MLAAMAPLAYSILLALGLGVALKRTGYQHFVALQLTLIFILPLSLEVILGGYQSSGAVFMWSFLAPLGSAFFQSAKLALRWFLAFLVGSISLVIATPNLPSLVSVNSDVVVQIFFGMNFSLVSFQQFFVFEKFRAFVTARHKPSFVKLIVVFFVFVIGLVGKILTDQTLIAPIFVVLFHVLFLLFI